jgi:2-keto-3-deoxy-L-rhamnonate aldolase RhmA
MRDNPVKTLLAGGGTALGCEISAFPSAEIPRLYAQAGFDFAFIDLEHTTFSLEEVARMVRSARDAGITPIVRVPQADYVWVTKVLDAGAQGIIVPRVNTAAAVRDIVSWVRHPPYGIRGLACTPAQTDGREVPVGDFLEHLRRTTLVVVQIERQEAVDNLEEMLAVPGVDCACLGYMDLSTDLGVPGEVEHPRMVAAVERLVACARATGVAAGIICGDLATTRVWAARGMRFISFSTDARLLAEAAAGACATLRRIPAVAAAAPSRAATQPVGSAS